METQSVCKYCRAPISEADFFCPNCGKKMKNKPLSTSVSSQAFAYLISVLLPPFGLWWAYRYIRQGGDGARKIGIAVIMLTVVSLAANVWCAVAIYDVYVKALTAYSGGLF